jgi:hypothetical protein
MEAKRLENGNLLVPFGVELEGGIMGDGVREIGPDHPDYEIWDRWLSAQETEEDS